MKMAKKIFFTSLILALFVIFTGNQVEASLTKDIGEIKEVLSRSNFIENVNKTTTSSSIELTLDLIGDDTCGNTKDQAKNIQVNTIIKERINYKEDIDVYKIVVSEKERCLIDFKAGSTYLNALFFNDSGEVLSNLKGEKAIFNEVLNTNEIYYLIVWHTDFRNGLGEYEISVKSKKSKFNKKYINLQNDFNVPKSMASRSLPTGGSSSARRSIKIGEEVFYIRINPFHDTPKFSFRTATEGIYTIDNMQPYYLEVCDDRGRKIADNISKVDGAYLEKINLFLESNKTYQINVNGDIAYFIVNLNTGHLPNKKILTQNYNRGKELYDNAEEGTQDEQYIKGSKNEFLMSLNSAKEIIDSNTSTQEEVDLEKQKLNEAIGIFQNKKIGDNFDRAINVVEYKINGVYNYKGDTDYFKFIPLESRKYKLSNIGQANIYFKLYDEFKNEINLDTDVKFTANKTYYIKVFSSSISVGVNYNVRLEQCFSGKIEYEYDKKKVYLKYIKLDGIRVIEFIYDNNGNLVRKKKVSNS